MFSTTMDLNKKSIFMIITMSVLVIAGAFTAQLAYAATPPQPVVQTYYVPLPVDDLNSPYAATASAANGYETEDPLKFFEYAWNFGTNSTIDVGNSQIKVITTIVARQPNTVIYYDQWENGYEADIQNPSSIYSAGNLLGTQIWGDNDPSNGIPPGFPVDLITALDVITLDNEADLPRSDNLSDLKYDGGDKFASTRVIVPTFLSWPLASDEEPQPVPGYKMGGSTEVWDTSKWGQSFETPIGEDTLEPINNTAMFNRSALSIMAREDGTAVSVDRDGDGTADVSTTLDEGENFYVTADWDGVNNIPVAGTGVMAGATVTTDKDVQVHLLTGHNWASRWESRFFALMPTDLWGDNYYTPISSETGDATTVWLYNPDTSLITVNIEDAAGSKTPVTVPANSSVAYSVPDTNESPAGTAARTVTGTHFYSTAPFYAMSATDTDVSQTGYDWGYSLVDADSLLSHAQAGWAVLTFGGTSNSLAGNPLWVMLAVPGTGSGTRIYVDYDADPSTGELFDPNGNQYDEHVDASVLTGYQFFDPDGDATGTHIYTIDQTPIQAVYGEDPNRANVTFDIDLGWTVPPLNVTAIGDFIYIDLDASGSQDDGEPGIGGVKVTLTWSGGSLVTYTAPDGSYLFPDLFPGITYTVTVDTSTLPAGMTQTADPDAILDNATTRTLLEGEEYLDADFGYKGSGSIGDLVWDDLNTDTVIDPAELGLEGVDVNLTYYGSDGVLGTDDDIVITTTTDENGDYLVENLPLGKYDVEIDLSTVPPGYELTTPLSGKYTGIELTGGSPNVLTADFGLHYPHIKSLYFSTPDQGLDRIDPVFTGDTTTANSERIGGDFPLQNENVRDDFTSVSYGLNSGSTSWQGPWVEVDDDQDPTKDAAADGRVNSAPPVLKFKTSKAATVGVVNNSIGRVADLIGATAATLSINLDNNGLDADSSILVQVSDDGGANWTTLETWDSGTSTGIKTYDLITGFYGGTPPTDYTLIRLYTTDTTTSEKEVSIEYVDITYTIPATVDPISTSFIQTDPMTSPFAITNGEELSVSAYIVASEGNIPLSSPNIVATVTYGSPATTVATTTPLNNPTVTLLSEGEKSETTDNFESNDYTGGTGSWTNTWTEVGETTGSNAGDIRVIADGPGGNLVLKTEKNDVYIWRQLDMGGAEVATLSVDYRLVGDEGTPSKTVDLQISTDGGASWTPLLQITGDASDTYTTFTTDITDYIDSDTQIRLGGAGTSGSDKPVYWDNLIITYGTKTAQYLLEWTGTVSGNYTVAAGEQLEVGIANNLGTDASNPVGYPFQIQYDSEEKPSKLILPADSYINIDSMGVYDAAYPGGSLVTDGDPGVARWLRAVVSDPFGADDITELQFVIKTPAGDTSVVTATEVDSTAGTKTYEYAWTSGDLAGAGTYTVDAVTREGTEGLAVNAPLPTYDVFMTLEGRVIDDVDGDGDLSERGSEAGIDNVTVQLYADSDGDGVPDTPGTPLQTVTTGSGNNGAYIFEDLLPGNYVIIETNPATYTSTNDVDAPNDDVIAVELVNASLTGQDFLDSTSPQIAPISGRVVNDADGDGDLSERGSEAGINGVTVELWIDSDGNGTPDSLYSTTTTSGNGDYTFADVPPGDYVIVETDPSGFTSTNDTAAPNDNWIPVTRTGGTASTDNDFLDSETPNLGSIGDTIFWDKDQSGTPDTGEGIADVTVWVDYDNDGVIDANEPSAITDSDGNYTLSDLPVGDHPVKVDATTLSAGFTNSVDPDGGTADGEALVTLGPAENNTSTDFGYEGTGSIGDKIYNETTGDGIENVVVYIDENNNGVRDPGEPYDTTDVDGIYIIDNLPAGTYDVKVDTTTLPTELSNTVDPDGTTDNATSVTLTAGETNTTTDWGYKELGSVSGRVYDVDGNSNLPGVLVELQDGVCTPGTDCPTTTTDTDGNYSFDGLVDGSYTIVIDPNGDTLPSGATNTVDPDGTPDGQTAISISGGNDVTGQDFGYDLPEYVTKSVSPTDGTAVNPGDSLTYSLVPSYTGTALLSEVRMTDVIPDGTTYIGDSDSPEATLDEPAPGATGSIIWDLGGNTEGDDGSAPGVVLCPAFTSETTVTTASSGDTYIEQNNADNNFGNNTRLLIDSRSGEFNHSLLKFDLSAIPSDAIVDSVTFGVQLQGAKDNESTIYEMTTSWVEGDGTTGSGATWNDSDGSGAGDWTAGTFGSGDYDNANDLGTIDNNQATNTFYTISDDLGGAYGLADVVKDWVANSTTNNGLVLLAGTTTTAPGGDGDAKYYSADDTGNGPYLIVTYHYPTTSTCTPTVRDEFTSLSFSNNDGTAPWAAEWVEDDYGNVGQDPDGGLITVVDGVGTAGFLSFKTEKDDPADGQNIYREVDLSGGVTAAALSYELLANGFDGGETMVVEVSNDGGATYDLTVNTIDENTTVPQTFNHDLVALFDALVPSETVSSQTRVRIRQVSADSDGKELRFDDVQIAWTLPPGPGGDSSLTASPTLVKDGDTVNLTLTVSSPGELNNITPATPTVGDVEGGASCASITGVDTAPKSIGSGGGSVSFTWTCTADDGTTLPASVDFEAEITSATDQYGNATNFSTATSNSVLMPPPLTFQVQVIDPAVVTQVDNQGTLSDSTVLASGVPSNEVSNPINTSLDFGDLADSYGTTLSNDGARHIIGGTYLGSGTTDAESDGPPSGDGTQDDTTGTTPDDEDGVTFGTLVQGQSASVSVEASGSGVLNAWADWNNDGVFQESELISNDTPLVAGSNTLNINVPPGATIGDTAIRFRVTDETGQGGDSPTGLALTGEVEDYIVTVEPPPGIVTGHLFIDSNGDGDQDPGEPDLANVDVVITDSNGATQTVTSDANGNWTATVPPGSTTADVDETDPDFPAGYFQTAGTDPTTVTAESNTTVDGGIDGYAPPGSIAGTVCEGDGDGQCNAEPALQDVTVTLTWFGSDGILGTDDDVVADTQTDSNGDYIFDDTTIEEGNCTYDGGLYPDGCPLDAGLPPGTYQVVETNPAGYYSVADADGGNPDNIAPIYLDGGEDEVNQDFEDQPYPSISGQVRYDLDYDGDLNDPDDGIGGVTISLYTDPNGDGLPYDGELVATTTTNPDGTYTFPSVEPGDYVVVETDPDGYTSTADVDPPNDNFVGVALTDADSIDNDFLDYNLTTCNANVALAALNLTSSTTEPTFPTSTYFGGYGVTFPGAQNVPAGYIGTFDNAFIPAGRTLDPAWAGDVTLNYLKLDSSGSTSAFHSAHTRITEYHDFNPGDIPNRSGNIYWVYGRGIFAYNGSNDGSDDNDPTPGVDVRWQVNYDFTGLANGYLPAGTLIGFTDIDGINSDGESILLSAVLDSSSSDPWLAYKDDAPNPAPTHEFATYNPGDNSYLFDDPRIEGASNDHILYRTTENLSSISLEITGGPGPNSLGMKFMAPVVETSCLSGTVRNDTVDDDTLDGDEPGIPAVTLHLYTDPNNDGDPEDGVPIATTVADANGDYSFPLPPAGNYVVVETDPADAVSDDDINTAPTDNRVIVVSDGINENTGNDFLDDITDPNLYDISGTVYDDTVDDDVIGPGDEPQAGVTVRLYKDEDGDGEPDSAEYVDSTVTDVNGNYAFPDLPVGNYLVIEQDPMDAVSEFDTQGSPTDNKIAVALTTDSTGNNFLDDGATGFEIGGQVRYDEDGDGDLDGFDVGIGDVTIELYTDPNGDGDPADGSLIDTTQTDADGNYTFTGVLAIGDYVVVETDPPTMQSTNDTDPPNDNRIRVHLPGDASSYGNDFLDGAGITSYTLTKVLVPPDAAVRPGEQIKFTISIENTGDTWIAFLPLQDIYDPAFISYGFDGTYAIPDASISTDDTGQIDWTDLTASRGTDLAPGVTWSIDVYFTAVDDTTGIEPDGKTLNQVIVQNALADPDGPDGPLAPDIPVPYGDATAGVQVINPTAVMMSGFDAAVLDKDVLLYWTTNSELEIAGFNVLRSLNGPFERLNSTMIPAMAAGANTGNVYSYLDNHVALSETYEYQLEIMLLDGNSQLFGLQEITVAADFQTYLGLIAK